VNSATVNDKRSSLEVFRSEFDYLCRTLRRLGVRAEDIEDDAQEIFLVLDRKWHQYDPSRPIRPYLFGIAFRVAASRRRRQRREIPNILDEPVDSSPQPDEALATARARELVLGALARIPLPRRAVLVMHDLDEVPMREVARTLSIPMFTGYSRLRKARKELEAAVLALTQEESEA
jgi:RNA polymerase sigma-70 factor, ECF subfamily